MIRLTFGDAVDSPEATSIPVRLALALLKDNLHLERMGDLCVTIAKLTKLTKGLPPDDALLDKYGISVEKTADAIKALVRDRGKSGGTATRVAVEAAPDTPGRPGVTDKE